MILRWSLRIFLGALLLIAIVFGGGFLWLRTSLPQQVMDMLGQQAAYQSL